MMKKIGMLLAYQKTINNTAFLAQYLLNDTQKVSALLVETYRQYDYGRYKKSGNNLSEQDYVDYLFLEKIKSHNVLNRSIDKELNMTQTEEDKQCIYSDQDDCMDGPIRADLDELLRRYYMEKEKGFRIQKETKREILRNILL